MKISIAKNDKNADQNAESSEGAPAVSNKPNAYIAARLRNPDEVEASSSGGSDTLAALGAIAATIVYVLIVLLLWFDWQALQSA